MTRKREILAEAEAAGVKFLRLQFTDIIGRHQERRGPAQPVREGAWTARSCSTARRSRGSRASRSRTCSSCPTLRPSGSSRGRNPDGSKVARLICDIYQPGRHAVRRLPAHDAQAQVERARRWATPWWPAPRRSSSSSRATRRQSQRRDPRRGRLLRPDAGGQGRGVPARHRASCCEAMGFEVEAAHHEVAPGQHEIDFKYAEAVADAPTTSRPSASW